MQGGSRFVWRPLGFVMISIYMRDHCFDVMPTFSAGPADCPKWEQDEEWYKKELDAASKIIHDNKNSCKECHFQRSEYCALIVCEPVT